MSIQWFPGHMHKARKKISEVLPQVDVIIEILDARLPFSSRNPLAVKLSRNKPTLLLLNKVDLADPEIVSQWVHYFSSFPDTQAIPFCAQNEKDIKALLKACKEKGQARISQGKTARLLVLGIPNVGKSTLLNHLLGRVAAKVGNQPAVTRDQMRVRIDEDLSIIDTPGILWPKIEIPDSSYRLAASGAIRETAFDIADVALFTAEFMLSRYRSRLLERYQIEDSPSLTDQSFLELSGANRGCKRKGGIVDIYKMSEIFLTELRNGKLGRISFETPEDIPHDEKQHEEQES